MSVNARLSTGEGSNIDSDMADHIGVMWQPDILALPVHMLWYRRLLFVAIIVDYEGTFDIDLDGGSKRRYSVQPVVICRGGNIVGCIRLDGSHTAHARRQLVDRRHAVCRAGRCVVRIIVYASTFIRVT